MKTQSHVIAFVLALSFSLVNFAFAGERYGPTKAREKVQTREVKVEKERTKFQFPIRLPWRKERVVETVQVPVCTPQPACNTPAKKAPASCVQAPVKKQAPVPVVTKRTSSPPTPACGDNCKDSGCACPRPAVVVQAPAPAPVPQYVEPGAALKMEAYFPSYTFVQTVPKSPPVYVPGK